MYTHLRQFSNSLSYRMLLVILIITMVIVMTLGVQIGFTKISCQDIMQVFLHHIPGWSIVPKAKFDSIIWELRLPRVLLSAAVGMGLSLSGLVMQAVVQNPLAEPYTLGISAGAALGTVLGIFLGVGSFWGAQSIGLCSFLGAVAATVCVIVFSRQHKNQTSTHLLLTGMAMSAVCSSIAGFITFLGQNKEGMEAATFWLMGSTANARLHNSLLLFAIVIIMAIYFSRQTRALNLLLLGPEVAITLGWDLHKLVMRFLLLNGLLIGFLVFNAGAVGFVGLIVPHTTRALVGSNHHFLLPVTVLSGGIVTSLVDIASRTLITGVDIPLGVSFAILGAPCFIYLMIRRKYRFGGCS